MVIVVKCKIIVSRCELFTPSKSLKVNLFSIWLLTPLFSALGVIKCQGLV